MKPVQTDRTNITYTMDAGGDLPAEIIYDPDETEPVIGVQSAWAAESDGERKAIANGAPLLLTVWVGRIPEGADAQRHLNLLMEANRLAPPPCALQAGPPPDTARPLLDHAHVVRALGWLFGALNANPPVDGYRHGADGDEEGLSRLVEHGPINYVLQHYDEGGGWLGPGRFLDTEAWLRLCDLAIQQTRDTPGDGPSIEGLALPGDTRKELG